MNHCNTCIHGRIAEFTYGKYPIYGCKLNPCVIGEYTMESPEGCIRYEHKTQSNQGSDYGFLHIETRPECKNKKKRK